MTGKIAFRIVLVLLCVLGLGIYIINKKSPELFSSQTTEAVLEKLTMDQRIGQLFILGVEGKEMSQSTKDLISRLHPGGILLLGKNIGTKEQLKKFISDLQSISLADTGLPLFIAIDQEGGTVSRIDWIENTPQQEIGSAKQAYEVGRERGTSLSEVGINLNFSPLLDIAVTGDFIYSRTFGQNATETGELAGKLVAGQKDGGILSTVKHFPGYGGIAFNPEDKMATLDKIPEFSQFQTAVLANPEFVMVTDVIYKELDPGIPFVFSKKAVDFLKKEVSGKYLVVSDDLSQYSFLKNYSLTDIVSLPIKAGIDVLIFSGWREPVESGPEAIKSALLSGKLSEQDINKSVLKIIELKEKIK